MSVTVAFAVDTLKRYLFPVTCNALLSEGLLPSIGAIMCMKSGQFYCFSVEDLKPVFGQNARETFDADDLIYVVDPEFKRVVIADVSVGVTP